MVFKVPADYMVCYTKATYKILSAWYFDLFLLPTGLIIRCNIPFVKVDLTM